MGYSLLGTRNANFGYTRDMDEVEPIDAAIALGVRRAREMREQTQATLASAMKRRGHNFQQSTVNKIEAGERRVSIGEAWALSKALDVTIEELLFGVEPSVVLSAAQLEEILVNAQRLREVSAAVDLDLVTAWERFEADYNKDPHPPAAVDYDRLKARVDEYRRNG